jgi:hypothetical protein
VRFRSEVQAGPNASAQGVDLQICTVVHINHIPSNAKSSGLNGNRKT